MGRLFLLTAGAAVVLATGCARGPRAVDPKHPDLACVSCHDGGIADSGLAAARQETCTASGCHADGGPSEVQLATVTFAHRNHADTAVVKPSCAGCHTHSRGGQPLTASVDACALCHIREIDGDATQNCQECHAQARHVTFTSQGLPLPHAGLPWVENTCVRCHYDVAAPPTEVSISRCQNCHVNADSVLARGMGTDLHPQHDGLACVSCHEAGAHRIFAMSSAVDLQCADCHAREHDISLTHVWPEPATCDACHATVHVDEQALLLGIVPGTEQAEPAYKFLQGLTCRSCHVRTGEAPAPATPLRGQPGSCGSCHLPQYDRIAVWWEEGGAQRDRLVGGYVERARTALAASSADSAGILLARADTLLRLLEHGGPQHNVELADRLFREALQSATAAYRVAGRTAPATPDLGPQARPGFCSFCHYRVNETVVTREMPADFHEQVMRRGRN